MIQPGKSFLEFDCWSNKTFKKYENVIQIMTSLFFTPINPRTITRSFTRCVMRWIRNVKSYSISYSWYFKVIFFKKKLIWPFQLLVPRLCLFLYLVYSRGQHEPTYVQLLWDVFISDVLPYRLFLYPDKQSRGIQQPKRWVTTNNNKDEDNSPKNHTQNITHLATSQKFWQIIIHIT